MSELLVADAEGVRRITMNRPEKRNALTGGMYAAMADALREAANRQAIRAILVTGGPECFTAGNDWPTSTHVAKGPPKRLLLRATSLKRCVNARSLLSLRSPGSRSASA